MSNLDFLSIPIGKYIQNNLDFGENLKKQPLIFSVNYFLRNSDGSYLNDITDKRVWYKWMELRVHGEVEGVETPTGRIPKYDDLARLFKEVLQRDYSHEDYNKQFTIRVPENLAKIERIKNIYETQVADTPETVLRLLEEQRRRLLEAREQQGEYISPDTLG
jgi:phosphoenolpyruvate carboxykinase (GTP)